METFPSRNANNTSTTCSIFCSFIFSIKTNRFVDRRLRRWNVCAGVTARTINRWIDTKRISTSLQKYHARPLKAVTVILFFERRL